MKLQGKQVRFRIVWPWFGRRRLIFAGKRNSIQLMETALVIEGYLQRFFFFPFIDPFFRMAFSEWTTVTVPYSRVLHFRYSPMLVARAVTALIFWLPVVLLPAAAALSGDPNADWVGVAVGTGLLGLLATVVTLASQFLLFVPRCYLSFRQGDGRRAVVSFRIPAKKHRLAFEEQFNAYRRGTREKGVPMEKASEAELAAPSPGAWVVLLLFLLGNQAVVPFVQNLPRLTQGKADERLAFALNTLLALLSVALTSLLLVARRSEPVRWAAVFALAVYGLLPLFRLALTPDPPHGQLMGPQQSEDLLAAIVSPLFHVALAVALIYVTKTPQKEERS